MVEDLSYSLLIFLLSSTTTSAADKTLFQDVKGQFMAELQNPPDGSKNMVILCEIKLINIEYEVMNINIQTHQGTLY